MKAVVGIDLSGHYESALDVFRRLSFPVVSLRLIHCIEPLMPDGGYPGTMATGPLVEVMTELERLGNKHLEQVAQSVQPWAPDVVTKLVLGRSAPTLIREAEGMAADLCVVGSERKGPIGSFFLGSVSRGLVLDSPASVLVGKQAIAHDGPLRVALATDLSDIAKEAIAKFARFNAKGIGSAVVVHAMDRGTDPAAIQPELDELAKVASGSFGCEVRTASEVGRPNEVIDRVMAECDLLVMGARGHGFLESWALGSTAAHQVVREPWNVLVLRP